jgi:hypothetical protein
MLHLVTAAESGGRPFVGRKGCPMIRLQYLGAAACLLAWLVSPASASDVVANFTFDGVTFLQGGSITGGFTLDLTTGTLSNVDISVSAPIGGHFTDTSGTNTFSNSPDALFDFKDVFSSTIYNELYIPLGVALTASNLATSTSFLIATNATGAADYGFNTSPGGCIGPCVADFITAGSLDLPATTPLPAALPLFATGLGGLGLLGWRRKRKAQAVAA